MWTDWIYTIAFYATAGVTLASACMVILHKDPVINALYLVLSFFGVAVLYVFLQAHFLAAVQVLLYAGAVLVLFLMIIMLINLEGKGPRRTEVLFGKAVGIAAVFAVILIIAGLVRALPGTPSGDEKTKGSGVMRETPESVAAFLISLGAERKEFRAKSLKAPLPDKEMLRIAKNVLISLQTPETLSRVVWPKEFDSVSAKRMEEFRVALLGVMGDQRTIDEIPLPGGFSEFKQGDIARFIKAAAYGRQRHLEEFGSTRTVGKVLFSRYMLPFEAASILLLGAIVGVLVLARRNPASGGSR